MSARDKWKVEILCPTCEQRGEAWLSEFDKPSLYSGRGSRIDQLPSGFTQLSQRDKEGFPYLSCCNCKTEFEI